MQDDMLLALEKQRGLKDLSLEWQHTIRHLFSSGKIYGLTVRIIGRMYSTHTTSCPQLCAPPGPLPDHFEVAAEESSHSKLAVFGEDCTSKCVPVESIPAQAVLRNLAETKCVKTQRDELMKHHRQLS